MSKQAFTQGHLEAIAGALRDTADGLTASEIAHLLASCGMAAPVPEMTKRHRLYNAFAQDQNRRQDRAYAPVLAAARGPLRLAIWSM